MAEIKIFITNLGKYNEGVLDGEWVELPATEEELADVYDRIEICHDDKMYYDESGNPYEEVFITDYETDLGITIGEYDSIDNLNEMAETIESWDDYDVEIFKAACEAGYASEDDVEDFEPGDYNYIRDVSDDSELAIAYLDEVYGGLDQLAKYDKKSLTDLCEQYFDYDAYGRDIRLEFDPYNWLDADSLDEDEIAEILERYGVDSIDDIDAYMYFDASSDAGIAEEWIDEVGSIADAVSEDYLESYFDYDAFGRDLSFDGAFVEGGFIFNN